MITLSLQEAEYLRDKIADIQCIVEGYELAKPKSKGKFRGVADLVYFSEQSIKPQIAKEVKQQNA